MRPSTRATIPLLAVSLLLATVAAGAGTEARPYDEREARPYDEREARPYDEREARPYDEREARPYDEREARPYDEREARPYDETEDCPYDETEDRAGAGAEAPVRDDEVGFTTVAGEPAASSTAGWLAPTSDGARPELRALDPTIPSPADVLGYPLGERFTPWHRMGEYLERLAAASDRVAVADYGTTYEDRPLRLVTITSPANHTRLEELRRAHLTVAAGEPLPADDEGPAIVWLGFGVHGNESSSAEAALATAYVLAAGGGPGASSLDDVVVLIDPLANPDGRERYLAFYRSARGHRPDPWADAAEHHEPWPGGRQNHYLVDLNRDWAWATQRETRHRLEAYRRWEPHVAVDLHEMRPGSTYFFPPATEPVHPAIDPEVGEWLKRFGQANAAAFDRLGWVYFARETFDLYYPGYGDAYPSLRGAVGMTYEMAGHGRAGLALRLSDGRLLTLADRVTRHLTTSLATVETAAAHRRELRRGLAARRAAALAAPASTYLWSAARPEADAAVQTLLRHGIEVGRLGEATTLAVRPLVGGEVARRRLPAGTWAVSTRQPLGPLVRSLLERDAAMPGEFLDRQRERLERNLRPRFYDITAWSLPLAHNLEAWVHEGPVAAAPATPPEPAVTGEGDLGFLVPPQGIAGFRLAADLVRRERRPRLALAPFESGGRRFPAGTLFVPAGPGRHAGAVEVEAAARAAGASLHRVASAMTEGGITLGSNEMAPLRPPRIGILGGEGIKPTSRGDLWFLLDRELDLPHHLLPAGELDEIDLERLDVVVMPDGRGWAEALADGGGLGRWVEGGGVLVAVGGAVAWLGEQELTDVRSWRPPEPAGDDPNRVQPLTPAHRPVATPGAALRTRLAPDHPLTVGLPAAPPALFRGTRVLLPSGDPRRDLLTVSDTRPLLAGFAWPEAQERLTGALLVGAERRGDGLVVVFSQDPVFRLFWRGTAPLFLNAVLYGPSLLEAGALWSSALDTDVPGER